MLYNRIPYNTTDNITCKITKARPLRHGLLLAACVASALYARPRWAAALLLVVLVLVLVLV